jgi:hypothetical protein
VAKKKTLVDNPLATLIGSQERMQRSREQSQHTYPTVSYRLPPEIVAELKAIAEAEGVAVGEVAAYALAVFCQSYRAGGKLPTREKASAGREVELPR